MSEIQDSCIFAWQRGKEEKAVKLKHTDFLRQLYFGRRFSKATFNFWALVLLSYRFNFIGLYASVL